MNIEDVKIGDTVFFAGGLYEVANILQFPHGKMVGIYDEPPSEHIDYLSASRLTATRPCNDCQRQGCPSCSGQGFIVK